MPLYKINDIPPITNPNLDSPDTIQRRKITKVRMYAFMFQSENGVNPNIYVNNESFEIISASQNYYYNKVGNSEAPTFVGFFMSWAVFLSDKLIDDEYVIGISEQEINICKRNVKLKRIINKLNTT